MSQETLKNGALGQKPSLQNFLNTVKSGKHFPQFHRIFKYIVSGATSTTVTLVMLYLLTHFAGVWYLLSTSIAYLVGFVVSFTLQKFWTFENDEKDTLVGQAFIYFLIVAANLGLNTLGVYILVEKFNMWYVLADIIVLFFIACESFFLYRILFKTKNSVAPQNN